MAELPEVFKHKEEKGMAPAPEGWYAAHVVKSDYKTSQNNKANKYIYLEFKILEGDFAGRIVRTNLNIVNSNPTAEAIAKDHFKQIGAAIDNDEIGNTEEMHGQPMQVYLVEVPATAAYPAKNEIKKYRSIDATDEDESNPFG